MRLAASASSGTQLAVTPDAGAPPQLTRKERFVVNETALFFAAPPTTDPMKELRRLCAGHKPPIWFIEKPPKDKAGQPFPAVHALWVPTAQYPPPDANQWRYRVRDVPDELQPKMAAQARTLLMEFMWTRESAVPADHAMSQVIADLADATGGYPWHEASRVLLSPHAWRTQRVDTWQGELPDVSQHISLDAYRSGDLIRIVSLGLEDFGLPDLEVSGVTGHAATPVSHLVNAAAQSLVESGLPVDGHLTLDFARIQHERVRHHLQDNPLPGATGKAALVLRPATPEKGDADNDLLSVDFEAPGASATERQEAAVGAAFGAREHVVGASAHDGELNAARDRAIALLPAIHARFAQGLQPGDRLTLKAAFATDDDSGTEYMWVEVLSWKGSTIEGTLANDPFHVKSLHVGARVSFDQDRVFDWIWRFPDGGQEGNETGSILEKMEAQGQ
jgi:uncharacterized protein YegJ (DUF2314 family)